MSTKIFLLIFATLFIIQTSLAEDKMDREQLTERVFELYIQMTRQIIASISKAYEPIINEAVINKDLSANENYALKVTELKEVFQRAADTPPTKRDLNILLFDIAIKAYAFENYIRRNSSFSEQSVKVRKVRKDFDNATLQIIGTFAEQTVAEMEKYWNGLTPVEQQKQQKLRDDINQIKFEESKLKKFMILDDIFDLQSEIREKF